MENTTYYLNGKIAVKEFESFVRFESNYVAYVVHHEHNIHTPPCDSPEAAIGKLVMTYPNVILNL